ncbi:pol [Symbiodinium sp. CCMP2592]|nr:pol [Symbiodinium sp. CCMP2592]
MGGFTQWAKGGGKGGGDRQGRAPQRGGYGQGDRGTGSAAAPRSGAQASQGGRGGDNASRRGRRGESAAVELERKVVRALRHGTFGFSGRFELGGYLAKSDLCSALRFSLQELSDALDEDARGRKTRIDQSRWGFLRAYQGHSSDCGHDLEYMSPALTGAQIDELVSQAGQYAYHGTDCHLAEQICSRGLLPGGGPGGRLACHFVLGDMPSQWSEQRGFRKGSNAVVQVHLQTLRRDGVALCKGAGGTLLTGPDLYAEAEAAVEEEERRARQADAPVAGGGQPGRVEESKPEASEEESRTSSAARDERGASAEVEDPSQGWRRAREGRRASREGQESLFKATDLPFVGI